MTRRQVLSETGCDVNIRPGNQFQLDVVFRQKLLQPGNSVSDNLSRIFIYARLDVGRTCENTYAICCCHACHRQSGFIITSTVRITAPGRRLGCFSPRFEMKGTANRITTATGITTMMMNITMMKPGMITTTTVVLTRISGPPHTTLLP